MWSKKSRRAAMAVKAPPTPPAPTPRIFTPMLPVFARPCGSGSLADVGHDVLDPRVVLEAVHRQVLAVAGVLEAAVRHLGHQRDVGVDPDAAEVQPLAHPHGPAEVPGPHARRKAELD